MNHEKWRRLSRLIMRKKNVLARLNIFQENKNFYEMIRKLYSKKWFEGRLQKKEFRPIKAVLGLGDDEEFYCH